MLEGIADVTKIKMASKGRKETSSLFAHGRKIGGSLRYFSAQFLVSVQYVGLVPFVGLAQFVGLIYSTRIGLNEWLSLPRNR